MPWMCNSFVCFSYVFSLGQRIVTEDCLTSVVGDKVYYELPILHILAKRNNIIATLTDCNGRVLSKSSCGAEGFRNARKKTTVAAQTLGISMGLKAQKLGINTVRVKLRGIGPNRIVSNSHFLQHLISVHTIWCHHFWSPTGIAYWWHKYPLWPRKTSAKNTEKINRFCAISLHSLLNWLFGSLTSVVSVTLWGLTVVNSVMLHMKNTSEWLNFLISLETKLQTTMGGTIVQ